MEANKALVKDWSSLPPEVLNLIAKDLREIPDFVRFRAVCTTWRISTPITDLHPQFPWILEIERQLNDPNLRSYSMSSDKFYIIHDPKHAGQCLYEISEGYMIANISDESQETTQLSLFNPLNNDEIPLPACHCYPEFFGQRYSQIGKYGLACAHSHQDSYIPELFHCRLGENQWCQQPGKLMCEDDEITYEHFFLKGMLFTLNRITGVTNVTDVGTGSLAYVIPPVGDLFTVECSAFLEAAGDILGVFTLYNKPADSLWEVRRLDVNESGSPCWIKVENIGNHALFKDVYGVFMLEANNLAGIKANCIYNLYENFVAYQKLTYKVERINIQTGAKESRQVLPTLGSHQCWFVPNLCRLRAQ